MICDGGHTAQATGSVREFSSLLLESLREIGLMKCKPPSGGGDRRF